MWRIAGRLAALGLVILFLSVSGCQQAEEEPSESPPEVENATIGVCLMNRKTVRQRQFKTDIENAVAQHSHLQLTIYDAQEDIDRQKDQIERLINDKVQAIIIDPVDAQALTAPVAKAFDAGIPVIVVNQAVIGDKYSCFITVDWSRIGREAARWLAGQLKGQGKIVEIKGPVDSIISNQLHEGFRSVLRDPGYRFVYEGAVELPKITGATVMQEALKRAGEINAVFACSDLDAKEAYDVAKADRRAKDVLWIGIGGLPEEGKTFLAEGILSATVLRPTGGKTAVDAVVKLIRGQTVPRKILLDTPVLAK